MMVLVDTTVWIDFFSANPYQHVKTLENLIVKREVISHTDDKAIARRYLFEEVYDIVVKFFVTVLCFKED